MLSDSLMIAIRAC